MEKCKINFSGASKRLAEGMYADLMQRNVSCKELDSGYAVVNYAGIHCPDKDAKACVKGGGDGVIEAEEVLEYAIGNYEKYREVVEGRLGSPLPWLLDDFNSITTFDAEMRVKVQAAIAEIKRIIAAKGIREGTEKYKEMLAVGLHWYVTFPRYDQPISAKYKSILQQRISADGLEEFLKYLIANGGIRVDGDYSKEYTALDAMKNSQGECTENSKILFAVLKVAGLQPIFVHEDLRREKNQNPDVQIVFGETHVCVGFDVNGRLRLLDPSLINSDANYKYYTPLLPRQYLSMDYSNRGNAWDKKGDPDKAIADYTQAIAIDPKLAPVYSNRGSAWENKGDLDNAIADYTQTIVFDPKYTFAYYNRGNAWNKKGDLDKAIADYTQAIAIDPKFEPAYSNRGNAWDKKGDLDKAIADYTQAIAIDPKLASAYYNRGNAWEKKGDLDKAIADHTKAIAIDPKLAFAYYNRGLAWYKKGDLDRAIADYTQAIAIDPKLASAYYNRGLAWKEKSDLDKAIADFTRAIAIDPKHTSAYTHRGDALENKGDLDKAVADGTQVILLDPKSAPAYHNRGITWTNMSRWDKAIADFTQAINLDPKLANSYFWRAISWSAKDGWSAAVSDIAAVLRLSGISFDALVADLFVPFSRPWQQEKKKIIADSFKKDTGCSVVTFQTKILLSYALWLNGRDFISRMKFDDAVNMDLTFNGKPSKTTKSFIEDILKAMPAGMQKDPAIQESMTSFRDNF